MRQKPDVVAPDNVNTTFFGIDIAEDADAFPNFEGTSAAAPHVAGAAALLLDAYPHLTRDEVYAALTSSAVDLGVNGRDRVFGHGLINAEAARITASMMTDTTGPSAKLRSPALFHGWEADAAIVQFTEPLAPSTATAAGNYELRAAGADGTLDTVDDVLYTVNASYDAAARTVTLIPELPTSHLPFGKYRLSLLAGITDVAGNPLNGGADQTLPFTIADKSLVSNIPRVVGTPALAVRGDGSAIAAFPMHPAVDVNDDGHAELYSQIAWSEYSAGGKSAGPSRTIPAAIEIDAALTDFDLLPGTAGAALFSANKSAARFMKCGCAGWTSTATSAASRRRWLAAWLIRLGRESR